MVRWTRDAENAIINGKSDEYEGGPNTFANLSAYVEFLET